MNPVADAAPAAALVLMFALGARHGIEPDHMAAIDGMTLQAHDRRARVAPWVGTLFAIGHGAGVTMLALVIHLFSSEVRVASALVDVLDWLPLVLLYAVGAMNLRGLLGSQVYQPTSLRGWLVPPRWRERSDAGAALVVGLLFALVLDVVTQVAAWSYSATQQGSTASVLLAGAVFSMGLAITATCDSALVCHLLRRSQSTLSLLRFRRGLGWLVVSASFGVAAVGTAQKLGWWPAEGLPTVVWLGIAGVAVGAVLTGVVRSFGKRTRLAGERA